MQRLSMVICCKMNQNRWRLVNWLYEDIFEKPYLETCGERYKVEASRLLQECNVGQYLENVWQRLEEERQRCSMFLHDSSLPKVRARFVQHMVTDHLAFLHGECRTMVQQEQCKNLRTMYLLLRLVDNGISVLVSELLEHIKAKGLEAVAGLKGENVYMQFIENSLAVYDKYRGIINDVFDHDQSLLGSLDKACSFVINHRQVPKQPCRSPEMLAKYCDTLLKKSSKGLSESEMEEKLTKSIIIFKYIDDKDVFQKFYSRMLAKRLIHQQSQSLDAEEAMINKLKQACGYEFTNKLHRMFTDITVSSDLNNKFSEFLKKDRTELGIHFFIHVLQAGAWPLGQAALTPFSLPLELEKSVQMFENFYYNHFSGRKLTWLHHLCQGEVKLNYLKKHYMITMQTFQMAILLQFEKSNSLSYSELQESTQLNSEQFSRHIASLVDSKLITCENEVPDETSVFSLNLNYSNKRTKLRITAALQRESPQEVEQTRSSVDEDRKLYLQAAVVRIMKSRKVLKHNALIQEILSQSQVSFAPTINMIKKSIESLIDKQYIERTPNSADEYSYVA
ncbi:cullin-2 isoform X2 [Bacillus rossius redtenbacheri]|uniref:cullin-2 isoform X2 n=1 Tax=Bacillus rossius redtenbacheri TaxID=93214 RepID=UPI002FDD0C97